MTGKGNLTLDEVHHTMLSMYHEKKKKIPHKVEQLNALLQKKRAFDAKTMNKFAHMDEYMDMKDQIKQLKKEIAHEQTEKKLYLLKNATDIFEYFEEKQKITKGINTQNKNVLNSFFGIGRAKPTTAVEEVGNDETFDTCLDMDKYTQSKKKYKYWKNINMQELEPHLKNIVYSYDICMNCGTGEMIHQDEEGVLICNNKQCGHYFTYIVDSSKPTNKEPPNEVSYTAYIRLNHFKEILSQFQAKETTNIPPKIIQAIRDRIKKERIDIQTQLNYPRMREILKKLKFNKYFEHVQYINSIFGIQPPLMNEKLTETLCVLFIEIQQPWALHCPPDRVNFFNYSYILYQLCVLLGQKQYLPFISLLKNDLKQKQQDEIWKLICRDLKWDFTPTV
jgi:hypothetical protein